MREKAMEEIKQYIATLLSSDDPASRRRAAEELSESTGFAPIAALAAALRDENQGVRDAATRSLSSIGTKNVARAVVEYLADDNITTRNLAASLLMHLKDESTEALLPYMYDRDHNVRKFVVDIVGMNGTREAAPHLVKLLQDPDENVVISTVEALGNVGSAEAVAALAKTFDRHPYLRATAAEALGKIGGTAANDFLLSTFQRMVKDPASDPLVLYTVIEALGVVGGKATYDALVQSLVSVRGKLRRVLINALVKMGERCGQLEGCATLRKEDLLDAMQDEDVEIQMSAAKGLGLHQDDETTGALLRAVSRTEALDGILLPLLEHRPRVMSVIVEELEARRINPTKEILSLMSRLISKIQYPDIPAEFTKNNGRLLHRAVKVVKESWSEATAETRGVAVDTLFRLDGDQAVEFLGAIARESDPWIRTHVIELLTPLDDPRIPGFIGQFLNDEDEMVRELAASTLELRSARAGLEAQ